MPSAFSLPHSQIYLLRSQNTVIKGNARLSILKIAMAISLSLKPVLAFTLCIMASHDEKLMNRAD